jgi:hypothetical protein
MLVRAMVISAGTPGGAYQADILRSYLEFEVPTVARSALPCSSLISSSAMAAPLMPMYGWGYQAPLAFPLVGVNTPKGYCFFLTNLPPRIGPRQLADLYRVRWEVELSIRLDKSVHRLDQIDAERPCSVKTLLHAALIASIIAALLAHTHNLRTRPPQEGALRTDAPLHPRRLALQLAVSCQSIAQALTLKGAQAMRCATKRGDGMKGNSHRLYQVGGEPLGRSARWMQVGGEIAGPKRYRCGAMPATKRPGLAEAVQGE